MEVSILFIATGIIAVIAAIFTLRLQKHAKVA